MEIQTGTVAGFGLRLLVAFLDFAALAGREVEVGGFTALSGAASVVASTLPRWDDPHHMGIHVRPNGRHEVTAPNGRWEYNPDSHMWESVEGSKHPPEWVPRQ